MQALLSYRYSFATIVRLHHVGPPLAPAAILNVSVGVLMPSWPNNPRRRWYQPGGADARRASAVLRHIGTFRLAALVGVVLALAVWNSGLPGARQSAARDGIVGYARVIDGDTIDVAGTRIRLHGIDAPEASQSCTADGQAYPCGRQATDALARLVSGSTVRCEPLGTDRYRRTLARCRLSASNIDIESWMVREGFAVAYSRYSYDYVLDEWRARIAGRGIWAGSFEWPWDYRTATRGQDRRQW